MQLRRLSTDHHLHDGPSCTSIIVSNSSTRLEKILSVEKRKPSTDHRALNGLSSLSVDGNTESEKKASEKEAKCGTTGGLNGPSVRSSTQTRVLGVFSLNRFTFYVRTSLLYNIEKNHVFEVRLLGIF